MQIRFAVARTYNNASKRLSRRRLFTRGKASSPHDPETRRLGRTTDMVNADECRASGIDIKQVESMARRLLRLSREMSELGIVLFGGLEAAFFGLTTAAGKAD